jgi:hypothetical protein
MFDVLLFAFGLVPLAGASIQDFRSKKGEFWDGWLYMGLLLVAGWKILIYPDTLMSSIGFSCFTGAIAFFFYGMNSWADGDALAFGMLGFMVPNVDITFFLVSGILTIVMAMTFDKLILESWGRKKFHWKGKGSHALWVILLVYLVYYAVIL